jgi:phosphoserine aminotransferase
MNFGAGPGALPLPVLEEAQRDLVSLPGVGASPLEVSHRGSWFAGVIQEAERNLRELLGLPVSHHVVFCQGGAGLQFSMVAMNLLRGAPEPARYVITGAWGSKAAREAEREGAVRIAWTGEADGFRRTPRDAELLGTFAGPGAYAHVTTNETIQGVQYGEMPAAPPTSPLVADMSSDFLSRPFDAGRFGLVYAGAQKNAGPAGVTVVVVRDDVVERIPAGLPTLLDYRTYVEQGSLSNTPPIFSIYVVLLVTRWLRDTGGLTAMDARNREKAARVYAEIDAAPDFYRGHADTGSRSIMNVTWRLPTEELERAFVAGAEAEGMIGLKGHRSVGGIRASLYNAVPPEHAEALAGFMRAFRDRLAD